MSVPVSACFLAARDKAARAPSRRGGPRAVMARQDNKQNKSVPVSACANAGGPSPVFPWEKR